MNCAGLGAGGGLFPIPYDRALRSNIEEAGPCVTVPHVGSVG